MAVFATALLLVPVIWGVHLAVRLTRAAWLGGAVTEDPLIGRGLRALGVPAPLLSLDEASALAPLDFRYPWRRARTFWFPGKKGPTAVEDVLLSQESITEAVRRAPSYAPPRYHLCGTASQLGQSELADRSALAALRLAPLHLDLRKKVAAYFRFRFEESGSEAHLDALLRSMGSDRGEIVSAILDRLTLTYEEMLAAFHRAGLEGPEMIPALEEAGRWDWALRRASAADLGPRVEGELRLRYARHLLSRGAVSSAAKECERSRELLGDAYTGWLTMGEAQLRARKVGPGLDALKVGLDGGGGEVREVAAVLAAAEVAAAERADFWSGRLRPGEETPEVEIEFARALVDGGRLQEAWEKLTPMLDLPGNPAEAHFLLARVFLASDSAPMALWHANKALELAPADPRYRALAAGLAKGRK